MVVEEAPFSIPLVSFGLLPDSVPAIIRPSMKITEALLAEHIVLLGMFDDFERALPELGTLAQIKTTAALLEGLLKRHAETESNLAYLALDHTLEDRGELKQMYQEHHEIDAQLRSVQAARTCSAASRLVREALAASREHFQAEERSLFPMLEERLKEETLTKLGSAWLQRTHPTLAEPALTTK